MHVAVPATKCAHGGRKTNKLPVAAVIVQTDRVRPDIYNNNLIHEQIAFIGSMLVLHRDWCCCCTMTY
jgi:hypothetical protein